MQSLDLASLRTHSWHTQACSAKTGAGIDEGLSWLIQDVAHRLYAAPLPAQYRTTAVVPNSGDNSISPSLDKSVTS